ncbi:unnamed protein product, partial [Staurois parvus]
VAHGRVWRWTQQWDRTGSSMRRQQHEEGTGAHGRLGAWQQLWEARNLPAPYDKKWNTPAV